MWSIKFPGCKQLVYNVGLIWCVEWWLDPTAEDLEDLQNCYKEGFLGGNTCHNNWRTNVRTENYSYGNEDGVECDCSCVCWDLNVVISCVVLKRLQINSKFGRYKGLYDIHKIEENVVYWVCYTIKQDVWNVFRVYTDLVFCGCWWKSEQRDSRLMCCSWCSELMNEVVASPGWVFMCIL
jgi:hypothetical protein